MRTCGRNLRYLGAQGDELVNLDERTCWYNVNLTDGLGPAAAQKVARSLHDRRLSVTHLLELDALQLRDECGLSDRVATELAQQLRRPLELPNVPDGCDLLLPGDEHFPNSLFVDANPPIAPVLWAGLQTTLLDFDGPRIGIAGSRDATEGVLELVSEFAKNASRQGWLVISGLAQGIDSAAHHGAMIGGTGTIGVLASGIANTSKSWSPDYGDEICLVSQFNPTDPWSGPRAMQRNSTIASLSDRVLVAAAGTSGGSWEMAQLCLKRKKPLFVLDLATDEAAGNQRLIKAGAIPVDAADLESCLGADGGEMTLFG